MEESVANPGGIQDRAIEAPPNVRFRFPSAEHSLVRQCEADFFGEGQRSRISAEELAHLLIGGRQREIESKVAALALGCRCHVDPCAFGPFIDYGNPDRPNLCGSKQCVELICDPEEFPNLT
jgi:hypothetical protein